MEGKVNYCVMIRNFVVGQQGYDTSISGIEFADVVYEAQIEAGYTRFMAIFSNKNNVTEEIGTIRSTRPHFIYWMREYPNSVLLHCGGSPEALSLIKASPEIKTINIIGKASSTLENPENRLKDKVHYFNNLLYYYNENEHSVKGIDQALKIYTTIKDYSAYIVCPKNLSKINNINGTDFEQRDFELTNLLSFNKLQIIYNKSYGLTWTYVPENNMYQRNNLIWMKRELVANIQMNVFAKTIIIQYIKSDSHTPCTHNIDKLSDGRTYREVHHPNKEFCYHIKYDIIAEGDAYIIKGGFIEKGYWRKDDLNSQTMWFDKNKERIYPLHDKLWIQVVTSTTKMTIDEKPLNEFFE
jgi:hypothetical protein